MEDLRDADLSARPEEDLTREERDELKRRFDAFVTALKEQALRRRAAQAPAEPKTVQAWQPPNGSDSLPPTSCGRCRA